MSEIPVTFKDIYKFLKEEEKETYVELELDKRQLKQLRHSGIKLTRQEWKELLRLTNEAIAENYRTLYFNQQNRTNIAKQIYQIESDNQRSRLKNLDRVSDIFSVMNADDFSKNSIGGAIDGVLGNNPLKNKVFELVHELPDSNGLNTNDVDLISSYDEVRDKLVDSIEQLHRVRDKLELVKGLNAKVRNVNGQDFNLNINEELKLELQRTLRLLDGV